ncbi:helix-turn-helix domain-containing protein [Streptomyces sp. NPDC101118]|uniref:helix-turn-helix domain-containing protein n=1 Tax=Streptomyces sp. NPDC101118 TaxID=3366109 RepID=UPI003815E4BA
MPENPEGPAPDAEAAQAPSDRPDRTVHELDARTLRGLAHPLRMRLLKALRSNGPATASQLAEQLGESSGATSYHLRQLAAYGFVEDAPEHGKGRERWWKSAHYGTRLPESVAIDPNPEVRGAVDLFRHEVATIHAQEASTWIANSHDWPQEWQLASDLSDFTLRLTAAETAELVRKLHDVINSYDRTEPAEDARMVRFHVHALPRTQDQGTAD